MLSMSFLQKVMEQGGRANWLAASTLAPMVGTLVDFPLKDFPSSELPSDIEPRRAYICPPGGYTEGDVTRRYVEAFHVIESHDWYLRNAPQGTRLPSGDL